MAVRLVKSKQTRLKHQSEFHFGCWICLVLNISGPGGAWSRRTVSKRRLFVFFWLCVLTQCWLSNGCQWRSLSVFQFSNQQLARWELCLAWIRCFAGGRALQEPPREFVIPNTWVMDAKAFKASIEFPSRFLFWCLSRPIHLILFVDEAKDGDMSATRAMICLSRGGQDAFQAAELSGARAMNHNEPASSMEQQFHDSPGVSRNFHQSPLSDWIKFW